MGLVLRRSDTRQPPRDMIHRELRESFLFGIRFVLGGHFPPGGRWGRSRSSPSSSAFACVLEAYFGFQENEHVVALVGD